MNNYLPRILDFSKDLATKSVLLLGPRRTGKSQYIEHQIKPDVSYNLLEADTFKELSSSPQLIRQRLVPENKIIAIDEIQKLPSLMDEVHSIIEKHRVKFVLTGSSARKLKRTHTGLMAGRARLIHFRPFTSGELGKKFNLNKILNYGTLPPVYLSDDPWAELKDYNGLYLREEVASEALVRKIENFSRFLDFAALTNGQILNFEALGSDAQIPARTVREYYAVLVDTLMGYMLEPISSSKNRKSISTAKFYFFDIGVVNGLTSRQGIPPKTKEFGDAFEHFVFLEIMAYRNYFNRDAHINFWNSPQEAEIDFILNNEIAIEVKATENIGPHHLKGFAAFTRKGKKIKRQILVCQEKHPRKIRDIEVVPIKIFLEMLWAKEIF